MNYGNLYNYRKLRERYFQLDSTIKKLIWCFVKGVIKIPQEMDIINKSNQKTLHRKLVKYEIVNFIEVYTKQINPFWKHKCTYYSVFSQRNEWDKNVWSSWNIFTYETCVNLVGRKSFKRCLNSKTHLIITDLEVIYDICKKLYDPQKNEKHLESQQCIWNRKIDCTVCKNKLMRHKKT